MLQRNSRTPGRSIPVIAAMALSLAGVAVWTAAQTASATPTVYEAESAALSGGAVVASDHTGFTGTGFVGGYTDANKGNANTSFTVIGMSAGSATVALRYANGTGAQMSLSLYVNGGKVKQVLLP